MRLRLLFLTSLASVAALIACEDDSGNGNIGTFDPDSGVYTPPDAATQDAATPDATIPEEDAAPDAEPPPPTDVTVHVVTSKGPSANVTIFFHDASGAVIGTTKTDATGTAKSTGATPAQVTALLGRGTARNLLTWTSVAGGDELFANDLEEDGEQSLKTIDVTFPGPYGNAQAYTAQSGWCRDTTWDETPELLRLYLYGDCAKAKNTVLGIAHGDGIPLAFTFKKDVEPPADGGTNATTLGDWTPASPFTVTTLNTPVDTYVNGVLGQISGGTNFLSDNYEIGEGATTFYTANGFAEGLQPAMFVQDAQSTVTLLERVAPTATSALLDFTNALPKLTEAEVDAADPSRPGLTWQSDGPLTATDGGIVTVGWWDGRDASFSWTFVVPPNATNVKAPSLPVEADDWAPRTEDGGSGASDFADPEILFVESDAVPDYKAFRREAGRLTSSNYVGDYQRAARIVLPTVGKLRATAYAIGPR